MLMICFLSLYDFWSLLIFDFLLLLKMPAPADNMTGETFKDKNKLYVFLIKESRVFYEQQN